MAAAHNDHITNARYGGILLRLDDRAVARRVRRASSDTKELPAGAPRVVPVQSTSIRPWMQVYDHTGEHLGQVKDVQDVDFSVHRPWRAVIRVPIMRVLAVMERDVFLNAA
jgi:hypothetical protein